MKANPSVMGGSMLSVVLYLSWHLSRYRKFDYLPIFIDGSMCILLFFIVGEIKRSLRRIYELL